VDRFDLGQVCAKCGGVATLHSMDALLADSAADEGGEGGKKDGAGGPQRRQPPSMGRVAAGGPAERAEVLPDLAWVGGEAAGRRSHLKVGGVTHVVICASELKAKMPSRDLADPPPLPTRAKPAAGAAAKRASGASAGAAHGDAAPAPAAMVYCSLALPDVIGRFEEAHGPGAWADAGNDDAGTDDEEDVAVWEELRAARAAAGPDEATWQRGFDDAYDFVEAALRLEPTTARFLFYASRGAPLGLFGGGSRAFCLSSTVGIGGI
jgi:hypothetical protein